MKEEIRRIMRLVQEGKLSPEDAAELIDAFTAAEAEEVAEPPQSGATSSGTTPPPPRGDAKDPLKSFVDLMDSIGKEVSQSVNWQEVAQQVRTGAKKGFESIKTGVEQIKEGKFTFSWPGSHEIREVSMPLTLASDKTLRVENPAGSVKISGGAEEGQVHAKAKVRGADPEDARNKAAAYTLIIEESDHYIDIRQPDVSGLHVDLVLQLAQTASVEVRTEFGDVKVLDTGAAAKVTSQSGNIHLRGLNGLIDISAQNGDVTVEESQTSTLSIENKSGDISIFKVNGNLNARSASGDVKVRDSSAKSMSVESVNGDVSVELAEPVTGTVNIRTVNGDAELLVPDMCDCRVAISTLRGDVQCEVPLQEEARAEQRITGRLGDGTGSIDVSAVNGDIAVRLREAAAV